MNLYRAKSNIGYIYYIVAPSFEAAMENKLKEIIERLENVFDKILKEY